MAAAGWLGGLAGWLAGWVGQCGVVVMTTGTSKSGITPVSPNHSKSSPNGSESVYFSRRTIRSGMLAIALTDGAVPPRPRLAGGGGGSTCQLVGLDTPESIVRPLSMHLGVFGWVSQFHGFTCNLSSCLCCATT